MTKKPRKLEEIYAEYSDKKEKDNTKRRTKYAQAQKEAAALDRVLQCFNTAYSFRLPLESYWNEWYYQYRQYLANKPLEGRANVFVPYSFMIIESIAPKLIAQNPRIEIFPCNKPFDTQEEQKELEEKARRVKDVIFYQWDDANMRYKIYEWVKNSLIYGTAWAKICWNIGEEHPDLMPLDIFDVYCDPSATNVEEAQYIIHKQDVTFESLKRNPNYKNLDKLKASMDNNPGDSPNNSSTDAHKYQRQMDTLGLPPPPLGKKNIKLKEFWGTFTWEGKEDEYLITIANDSIVIRCEPSPYVEVEGSEKERFKPFLLLRDQPVPGELYGIGECESVRYQQRELNTNRNQRIDNKNLIINKQYKVRANANVNPSQLRSIPGNIVFVNDMQDVQELVTNPIGLDASYKEEQTIKSDMENITGATAFALGQQTSNVTATTEVSRTEQANDRFRMKLTILEIELKRLGEMMLALDRQYLTKDVIIRITGDQTQYQAVSPEDFEEDYALQIGIGSTQPMNKATRLQQFLPLYQYLKGNMNVDQRALDKHLIELWDEDLLPALMPPEDIVQTMMGQMPGMQGAPSEQMTEDLTGMNSIPTNDTEMASQMGSLAGEQATGGYNG